MKIDYVVIGEVDYVVGEFFREIESGSVDEIIFIKGWLWVEYILMIVVFFYKGFVEVMRGCGRGCCFCELNLRVVCYMLLERIEEEIRFNVSVGIDYVWFYSEDVFLYCVEDKKNFYLNVEVVVELFEIVRRYMKNVNLIYGVVVGVLVVFGMIEEIFCIVDVGLVYWIGI